MIAGSTILITGGTGFIGRCLVKSFCEQNPKKIIVFSRDEEKHFHMKQKCENPVVQFVVGDIRDRTRLDSVLNGVDYVFHTAAMKQVPIAEDNPFEAVMTNIIGTYNVIQASIHNNVKKVLCISSDKAVLPTNCMGMTKGISEKLVKEYRNAKSTEVVVVRLGNVLGSSGSVIPVWEKQIREKNQIALTSVDMTRFVMSIDEVRDLILHTLEHAQNGEIVFSHMEACRIVDLAHIICAKHNLDCDKDIKIIGIRKGEKTYEELFTEEEAEYIYELNGYFHISTEKKMNEIAIYRKSNEGEIITPSQLECLLQTARVI